ncbi:CGL109 [Auxenochlorella protothecoides x Auxenochlorella symbiontica]|uniref:Uncharacterized protein n=2 Tax=Auxenochlorella protothecoides TaxID=3075 RepID=A0A1D2A7D0_AUXPR
MSQRAYNVWTAKEVEALKRGVEAHGVGFWEQIRSDPQFEVLRGRTGVQLKDKWRNIVKFQRAAALRNEAASPASARWSRRGPRAVRTPSPPPSTAASPLPIFKEEPGVAERMYVAALAAACTTSALASRDPCPANIAACAAASADLHLARVRLLGAGAPCPSHAAGQRRSGSAPSVQGFDRGLAGPAGAHGVALPLLDLHRGGASSAPAPSGGGGHHPDSSRVAEDRRYGIYDQRRYVHAAPGGEGARGGAKRGASLPASDSEDGAGGRAADGDVAHPRKRWQASAGRARRASGSSPGPHAAEPPWGDPAPRPRRAASRADAENGEAAAPGAARCQGCGLVAARPEEARGPLRRGTGSRIAFLCPECQPASLSPGEAEGVNPSGQLDQVLSAARQLSMDRMGSMNDSLVLDIAAFMEVLPLSSLTPRAGSGAGGPPPPSPLPRWGGKRARRTRHAAPGTRSGEQSGAEGPEHGGGGAARRRPPPRELEAVRQLASVLPPELALPPAALLEMYHALGGEQRPRGVQESTASVAAPAEGGAARHAFQPLKGHPRPIRTRVAHSRSPTPPLPDAAVTPPAEVMRHGFLAGDGDGPAAAALAASLGLGGGWGGGPGALAPDGGRPASPGGGGGGAVSLLEVLALGLGRDGAPPPAQQPQAPAATRHAARGPGGVPRVASPPLAPGAHAFPLFFQDEPRWGGGARFAGGDAGVGFAGNAGAPPRPYGFAPPATASEADLASLLASVGAGAARGGGRDDAPPTAAMDQPRRRLGGVELFDPGAPTAPDWASLLPGVLEGRQQPLAQETVAAVVAAMSAWN